MTQPSRLLACLSSRQNAQSLKMSFSLDCEPTKKFRTGYAKVYEVYNKVRSSVDGWYDIDLANHGGATTAAGMYRGHKLGAFLCAPPIKKPSLCPRYIPAPVVAP